MNVWEFINDKLNSSINVMLLYVLESEGSSPGRQGFKMAVAADGSFAGTIGGGIMEHKLVEKAKAMLQENVSEVLLMRQYHDKEHNTNQSGMICSGNQLNAFVPISFQDKKIIEKIIQDQQQTIFISTKGIRIASISPQEKIYNLKFNSEEDWEYSEKLYQQPVIHIIGGGHVGLALSELMHFLDFYVNVYDDRPQLNTMQQNSFANKKYIVNYENIGIDFTNVENDYVVVMTIGYRTDKAVLKQLINKPFFYLGLLGSQHKIETLFKELKEEGIEQKSLDKIFSPIGLNIASKTTQEIAVSIAAEIIREKNKSA